MINHIFYKDLRKMLMGGKIVTNYKRGVMGNEEEVISVFTIINRNA
jgi:hypothetical protein